MSVDGKQIRKRSRVWWLGIIGLVFVVYQFVNIVQAFIRYFSFATLLYTLEIILMVVAVQMSVALLKRS